MQLKIDKRTFWAVVSVGVIFMNYMQATAAFPIATNSGFEMAIGAAWDGTNYLVGIEGDAIAVNSITAQLVSPAGALIGSRIKVAGTGGVPFVAFGGTNSLLIWQDDVNYPNDVLTGQLVAANGTLIGTTFSIAPLPSSQEIWGLASGVGSFLAFYSSGGANGSYPLYSRLISPLGTVSGANLVGTAGGRNSGINSLAFGGTNYLAVWDTGRAIRGRFISGAGNPAPADFLIHTKQQTGTNDAPVSLAFDAVHSRYLVVWHDQVGDGGTTFDLFGQLVAVDGSLAGAIISISGAPGGQYVPSIAFDGENYLINWTDRFFTTNANFRFRLFSSGGQPLGAEFSLATPPGATVPFIAPVFCGGNQFLTVATYDFADSVSGNVYGSFIPRSTAPPRLDVAGPLSGAQFPLRLTVTPGINYIIQASTNLGFTNWTALATNSATDGTFIFTDTQATNANRFYRAVKQ